MPTIALNKGRLLEPTLEWLARQGLVPEGPSHRALRLPLTGGWDAVLLKGPDVPVFVQNGAADLGIVGSDVLEEDSPDVYDLRALDFGRCRLSLAAPEETQTPHTGPLRVASKYPRLAERLLTERNYWVRVIRVSSSTELAPALGLSDVIVDIVDTGRTLRENGLQEKDRLLQVEAHLIANRRAYRFLGEEWIVN